MVIAAPASKAPVSHGDDLVTYGKPLQGVNSRVMLK